MVLIHTAVRKDQNVGALFVCPVAGDKEALHRTLERGPFII